MKIESGNIQLEVTDTGVGDTALVFLHFWGGSSRTWADVMDPLRGEFRCVAIDARGAGDSDAPVTGYSTEDHARDVLAVVRSLGLARYALVGHSMGGKAAQVLAAQRPAGLIGVALIASSPPSPMEIDETQRAQMRQAYASRETILWTLQNVLVGSAISDEWLRRLVVDAQRLSAPARVGWVDVGSREDFSGVVADIEVPVVAVSGDADRVDPTAVVREYLHAHYPRARLHVLPGKGHLLPVEAPAAVAAIVADFMAALG